LTHNQATFAGSQVGTLAIGEPAEGGRFHGAATTGRMINEVKMLGTSFDAIDLLTRDHRMLEQLLEELDHEEQSVQATLLFVRIIRELAAHEEAEKRVVFPSFRMVLPAADAQALEQLSEHQEINDLLAEMRRLMPDEPGFDARARALRLELQTHFEAEEESVFPRVRACLDQHRLLGLAAQVMTARAGRPGPATATSSRGGHS
jgi:hemerythrin superfamily protein